MKANWQLYGIASLGVLVLLGQTGNFFQSWQLVAGLMVLAVLLLLWRRPPQTPIVPPTRAEIRQELRNVETVITKIRSLSLQKQLQLQASKLESQIDDYATFTIGVYGAKGVGKTALINSLKGLVKPPNVREPRKLILLESRDLSTLPATDLILFVIDGILKASEYRELLELHKQQKRVVLILNKSDTFLPSEIDIIKSDIGEHTVNFLAPQDILVCASAPSPIKVKQPDGKQWLETVPPDVKAVKQRLEQILATEWDSLQVQNLKHQVEQLHHQAHQTLCQDYRRDGEKIIQKYQWITGATVFANPLSGLDLLANAAINVQMLLELSQAYDRPITITEAKEMAAILAQAMLKLGIVELVTSTIGNMIKFNTLTFALGGSLQAFTAAYLTRVGGISFMKYIEQELPPVTNPPQPLEVLCQETYRDMGSQPLIRAFLQEASLQIATPKG
ncbi:MAG: DUF697 domain-containing protein [Pseudanabaenaceae cyanobacterium SKYGB_i_bin29]|nr:DUF697 domain-containing protein [Pseudanabaenaceae cyanobacterium SKYG29]MDW8420582.1 DUF697 domain-containing protein [Pseudanabaenaceae cyanobacterium SKYGB_i_bin29]